MTANEGRIAGPVEATAEKPKKKKVKIHQKAPIQERSRQTVAVILDACSRILIREGFFGVTTDKIAKEAGVSIGSLYQFFGNKESVVSAVVKNLIADDKQFVMRRYQELGVEGKNPAERMRTMISITIESMSRNWELRAKLQNIQLYLTDVEFMRGVMKEYEDVALRVLPPIPGRDMQKVAYVVVNSFAGLIDRAIIDYGDLTKQPGLVDEIYHLYESYILTDKQRAA